MISAESTENSGLRASSDYSLLPKEKVKKLLNSIVDIEKITFYLGGHGSFDEICVCVCRELKKNIKIGKLFMSRHI